MPKYRVYACARGSVSVEAKDEREAQNKAACLPEEDFEMEWDYEVEDEQEEVKDGSD